MRGLDLANFDVPSLVPRAADAYVLAFLCTGVATALRIAIDPYVAGVQFVTFFPAVIIAALIGGFGAGLFCIALSALAVDFFVLHPRFSFQIENRADVWELLLFFFLALFIVVAITTLRQAAQNWRASKDRLQFALDAAQLGWWEYDPIHDTVWWDGRSRELFKVAKIQTGIEDFKKRVHPDDIERVWAAVEAALDPLDPKPYATEYRIQPDLRGTRWVEAHGLVRFDGVGGKRRAVFMVGTAQDITLRKRSEEQRTEREEKERLLIREINHRAKNMLSVVEAIAHQTATRNPEDFIERFSERIHALSANQDLLVRNQWQGVEVEHLVRAQLAHFADLIGSRIVMDGPRLRLNAVSAQAVGLALHELATNAGKYGALSVDTGCVDVRWKVEDDAFTMKWTERKGPPVSAPKRRGFGTIVMTTMAERSLGGEVSLDYAVSGVTWRMTCPATSALEPAGSR
jgi:two-component sensor histidine kinase/PAS domain-containing protein